MQIGDLLGKPMVFFHRPTLKLPTLPETNSSPLKIGQNPKGKACLPTNPNDAPLRGKSPRFAGVSSAKMGFFEWSLVVSPTSISDSPLWSTSKVHAGGQRCGHVQLNKGEVLIRNSLRTAIGMDSEIRVCLFITWNVALKKYEKPETITKGQQLPVNL